MGEKVRVGVLGMTHDHVWGSLDQLDQSPLGELVAVADPNQELLDKAKGDYGCDQLFMSAEELLEQVDLDAVYIFSDNASGVILTEMAADVGLHVLIEKPMASSYAGAVQMMAAARAANIKMLINWPFNWWPSLQKAMNMAQNGEIGKLFSVKYRSAHAGPKELGCTHYFYDWLYDAKLNGAGALMDYCCYGAALSRYLLGRPSRVTGVAGNLQKDYITVDDNAVIITQGSDSIGIAEASWIQIGHLTSYTATIYGSEGTLVIEPRENGRLLLATRENGDGIEVEVPPLPPEQQNATAYFLHCIVNDQPVEGLCCPKIGRDTQEILEAGLISSIDHTAISLPLPMSY